VVLVRAWSEMAGGECFRYSLKMILLHL
jgi:hypothetical protein